MEKPSLEEFIIKQILFIEVKQTLEVMELVKDIPMTPELEKLLEELLACDKEIYKQVKSTLKAYKQSQNLLKTYGSGKS